MQNPRLAGRYAKSLLDLSVERNSLETTLQDMQAINNVCTISQDFAVMLRSPVISGDKKLSVIFAVLGSAALSELTKGFVTLLVTKGRELNLPEIAAAFVEQYNELKNIKTVRLTTAVTAPEDVKESIAAKVATFMPGDTIKLETIVDERLIGGFVLEIGDKLFDASVRKCLNDIKSRLIDNSYVSKI